MPPQPWTRDSVCAALVMAFRRPQGAFLATPRQVELTLNWRLRVPDLDPQGWRFLLVWAECRAGSTSVEERRRGMGWSPKRFQCGWRLAADTIAAALNAEEVNPAAVVAGEQAAPRLATTT